GYDNQEMLGYLERKILGMTYLERCTEYSTSVNILLKNVFIGKETDINLQRMRSEILRNALNGSDVVMGAQWFNNMTKYINILK
ncbi:Guanylate cyclase 32E Guanylate cyclase soluble subunit beta-2, partial [Biomphalaria pfeifferi]